MAKKSKSHSRAEELLDINAFIDERLETCLKAHLGLRATLERVLPAVLRRFGAKAAIIHTLNEERVEETFSWGTGAALNIARLPARPVTRRSGKLLWAAQPLDVAGEKVGTAAIAFPLPADPVWAARRLDILCEELDGILWTIHTAIFKQNLVARVTRALTRRIFQEAIDDAVAALREAIPFERLALIYLDESGLERRKLHYRIYDGACCTHGSGGRRLPELDEAIRADGIALLSPDRHRIARVLDLAHSVETLFIIGITEVQCLGQVVVSTRSGLNTMGRDLLNIFANAVSQRLIDYRRERSHLARSFSGATINRLLTSQNYRAKHLKPRLADVAILFADLNSFTRLCEKALITPSKIGNFINYWSKGAVRIIFKHGGAFDKMIGDCVIAHFGPPFFRTRPEARVLAAVRTALDLQEFTRGLKSSSEFGGLAAKAGLSGLGVAVGINFCRTTVGLFGPDQDFTAFSSGMNQTSRLQSLGGFREIFVMDRARRILGHRGEFRFEGPLISRVKNVAQPLRYFRLSRRGREKSRRRTSYAEQKGGRNVAS